ncbi:SAUR family protein [Vigna unguiculata]|uniref:SAUR family protein n=1 Tax=Vigna unguiculata TaxID=3917 RepID=A0A4D6LG58_VIGUN|nr:SAUR family protein [Vigna unguiculata]
MKRFVIPVSYLNLPLFQDLLSEGKEEFGYYHSMGGLTIPCNEDIFQRLDMRLGMGVIGGCKNNNWCVADTAPGGLKVCARREELQGGFCNNWHLAVRWDPPGGRGAVNVLLRQTIVLQIMTCGGSYPVTLAWGYERGRFVCSVLTLERCYVRGGMGLVDHMCWTTSSSPFLFLYGDDRVIRYTGADIDTCDVDDAQATE